MAKPGSFIERLKPTMLATVAAERTLRQRFQPLIRLLKQVRCGQQISDDSIHQLRVGSRRAAAALNLYRPLLPASSVKWWRRRLRKLRRAAGPLRNLDVLLRRLDRQPVSKPLQERLQDERHQRLTPLRRRLDKLPAIERLQERMKELLAAINWDDGDAPTFVEWSKAPLMSAVESFLAAEPAERRNLEQLHQFRVAGKRLRYTLELLAPAIEAPGDELYSAVEELQSRLGAIQDHHDACRRLSDELDKLTDVADIGRLTALIQSEAQALIRDVNAFWKFWRGIKPGLRALRKSRRSRSR